MSISNRTWESSDLLFINVSCYQRNMLGGRITTIEHCTRREEQTEGADYRRERKQSGEFPEVVNTVSVKGRIEKQR